MSLEPLINGHRYGWSSIEIKGPKNRNLYGVKSVEFGAENEQAEARGLGKYPLGFTEGLRKFSAKIELLLQDAYEFQALLGSGYMSRPWILSINYAASFQPVITTVIFVSGIKSTSSPNETGDALTRSYDLNVIKIVDNGLLL